MNKLGKTQADVRFGALLSKKKASEMISLLEPINHKEVTNILKDCLGQVYEGVKRKGSHQ